MSVYFDEPERKMNAQQLLNQLQQIAESGVELSALEVVVPWEFDDGRYYHNGEQYPTSADPLDGQLLLT